MSEPEHIVCSRVHIGDGAVLVAPDDDIAKRCQDAGVTFVGFAKFPGAVFQFLAACHQAADLVILHL